MSTNFMRKIVFAGVTEHNREHYIDCGWHKVFADALC